MNPGEALASASMSTLELNLHPILPDAEEQMLRETVHAITSSYGPKYARRCREEDRPPTELWDELAGKGYMGVNIPEEYGGGGLGMLALSAVGEELAAAGVPLLFVAVRRRTTVSPVSDVEHVLPPRAEPATGTQQI